jgi:hypothetical protein
MTGLDVRCEEIIRRSPAEVWRYVAEGYFEHHARWDPAITGMEKTTDGPIGAGTRGVETRRFLGKQRAAFEIDEYVAPVRFEFRNTSGPFAVERSYVVEPDPAGARLTFTFRMAPTGPTKLIFPLLRRGIERQVRANIARIPRLLEPPDQPTDRAASRANAIASSSE